MREGHVMMRALMSFGLPTKVSESLQPAPCDLPSDITLVDGDFEVEQVDSAPVKVKRRRDSELVNVPFDQLANGYTVLVGHDEVMDWEKFWISNPILTRKKSEHFESFLNDMIRGCKALIEADQQKGSSSSAGASAADDFGESTSGTPVGGKSSNPLGSGGIDGDDDGSDEPEGASGTGFRDVATRVIANAERARKLLQRISLMQAVRRILRTQANIEETVKSAPPATAFPRWWRRGSRFEIDMLWGIVKYGLSGGEYILRDESLLFHKLLPLIVDKTQPPINTTTIQTIDYLPFPREASLARRAELLLQTCFSQPKERSGKRGRGPAAAKTASSSDAAEGKGAKQRNKSDKPRKRRTKEEIRAVESQVGAQMGDDKLKTKKKPTTPSKKKTPASHEAFSEEGSDDDNEDDVDEDDNEDDDIAGGDDTEFSIHDPISIKGTLPGIHAIAGYHLHQGHDSHPNDDSDDMADVPTKPLAGKKAKAEKKTPTPRKPRAKKADTGEKPAKKARTSKAAAASKSPTSAANISGSKMPTLKDSVDADFNGDSEEEGDEDDEESFHHLPPPPPPPPPMRHHHFGSMASLGSSVVPGAYGLPSISPGAVFPGMMPSFHQSVPMDAPSSMMPMFNSAPLLPWPGTFNPSGNDPSLIAPHLLQPPQQGQQKPPPPPQQQQTWQMPTPYPPPPSSN